MTDQFSSYGSTGLPDEYVQRIGEIVVLAAHLERIVEWCAWKFIGGMNDAFVHPPLVTTAGMRVSSKLKLLRALVEIKLHDQEKQEFVQLIGRAKELFRIRDQLAHGSLGIRFTGGNKPNGLNRASTSVDTRIRFKNWEISEDDLSKTPAELMTTASAFSKFMKRLDQNKPAT